RNIVIFEESLGAISDLAKVAQAPSIQGAATALNTIHEKIKSLETKYPDEPLFKKLKTIDDALFSLVQVATWISSAGQEKTPANINESIEALSQLVSAEPKAFALVKQLQEAITTFTQTTGLPKLTVEQASVPGAFSL